MKLAYVSILALCAMLLNLHASFNVTYLNTTVVLNTSTSAHVVEKLGVYVSNTSVSQYVQDRQAFNLTLNDWQKVLGTTLLTEHIIGPNSSISRFTLLPGPIILGQGGGGTAVITFSYDVHNVTTIRNIAPRKFDYTFNDNLFNFEHTAGGQALYPNTRLIMVIPKSAEIVSIYPAPDYPLSNYVGNYSNATVFSWYAGEPLSKFQFSYIVTQSLQSEVVSYFSDIYNAYSWMLYLAMIVLVAAIAAYAYFNLRR
ncbi:MAG: hypothetical protein KGI00_02450 [Candidatus Micrarchaeota archaeon]|nr:hypothetical protein [Candidatus Micrarchaeota archaeon]MDE1823772.1 hypothetical protein [Candidatus Micrarchaeota archaeon]MDE1849569.1 hypothetical protein [Candidatus Micrarchaeota archaeon]